MTKVEIQWWRPLYTLGDRRKAGPWVPSRDEAWDWVRSAPNITEVMRRTVRYEALSIEVEGSEEGVADALKRLLRPDVTRKRGDAP